MWYLGETNLYVTDKCRHHMPFCDIQGPAEIELQNVYETVHCSAIVGQSQIQGRKLLFDIYY